MHHEPMDWPSLLIAIASLTILIGGTIGAVFLFAAGIWLNQIWMVVAAPCLFIAACVLVHRSPGG